MTATWETDFHDHHCLTNGRSATIPAMATSKRAALHVGVSTTDRGQTVEKQLQPLHEAVRRLGGTVVAIYRDEGIRAR